MRSRSPARILAPLALAAAAVALILVLQGGGGEGKSGATSHRAASSARRSTTLAKRRRAARGRTYVVKDGDILSAIAAKTGVPVATLEDLNPKADPQSLHAGQRLKIRP